MKQIVAAAVGMLACGSVLAADDVTATLRKFNVQEDATPVRERKDWRVPKKMVVMRGGPNGAQREEWARRFPGVQIVYTSGLAEAKAQIKDADVVVGITAPPGICEPELIAEGKQLRWIMSISAGVEPCMTVPAIRERNLLITNGRGIDSAAIGEHAIALAMAMARGIDTFVLDAARKRYSSADAVETRMETLTGKTLLVVGLGGIGNEVAVRAHGLGMKVIATRNSGHNGPDYVSYVGTPDELLKLAATADVIVSCVPLTKETTNLYDEKFFAAMKPTAYFVNIARAGSVVQDALIAALNGGKIAGAALDVVSPEPLPPQSPLWDTKNLIITPHISAGSDVPNDARWVIVNENIRRYMAGEKMLSVVDFKKEY